LQGSDGFLGLRPGGFLVGLSLGFVIFLRFRWHPRFVSVLHASPRTGATLEARRQSADASAEAKKPKRPRREGATAAASAETRKANH